MPWISFEPWDALFGRRESSGRAAELTGLAAHMVCGQPTVSEAIALLTALEVPRTSTLPLAPALARLAFKESGLRVCFSFLFRPVRSRKRCSC